MAFDITTARPVNGGFDIKTARPEGDMPTSPQQPKKADSALSRFGTGMMDSAYGISQIVPRGISQMASLGGMMPNAVSDFYQKDAGRIDAAVRQREAEYQSPDGFDWARLAGNVASPVNWVGGGAAMKAPSLLGKIAAGAAVGGAQAAAMPVTDTENFASNKAKQVALGAVGGGAAPLIGAGVGRVLNPKTDKAVKSMLNQGVKLTPGEMSGGIVKGAEDALTSVPLLGSVIKGAKKRSIESLNRVAIDRALKPIGGKLPSNIELGRDAIEYAGSQLSKAYDDLLPKLTGKIDDEFVDDVANIVDMVDADDIMNAAEKSKFNSILDRIVRRVSPSNGILGHAIKDIESELGETAATLSKGSIQERGLAGALREVQDSLRNMVTRSNPEYAKELSGINRGWANFKRVQKASGAVGTDMGVFTPAQLQNAVRALDKSKDKSAFSKGAALMQDLSDPAKSRMASSIPNSGTADRLAAMAVLSTLGGGAVVNPLLMPAAATGAAYLPIGRRIAQAILTERPEIVRKTGDLASKYAKYLSTPTALTLSNNKGNK